GLTTALLAKNFEKQGTAWTVKLSLRRRVRFLRINLAEPFPPLPSPDVVFLRNVLIYFAPEAKRRALARVRRCLASGSVLLLGGAETTLGIDDAWERVTSGKAVSYRVAKSRANN